jgi:periplasmic copper chaperone A
LLISDGIHLQMISYRRKNQSPSRAFRRLVRTCVVLALGLLPAGTIAAPPIVQVSNAWARATVPGQQVAGVYFEIRAPRKARLVAVKSDAAASAEIHSMSNDGGVMRMRKLDGLPLPAGQTVQLKPNGNHIMLLDIKQQLKPGEKIPITLIVQQGRKKKQVTVEAEVREVR